MIRLVSLGRAFPFLCARCRMPSDRSGRRSSLPVHQPTLLLGHGPVHWDTLPREVRERALALWLQLLTEHGAPQTAAVTAAAPRPIGGPAR